MGNWQKLEIDCCNYLNNRYGSAKVKFEVTGGSDSNAPDIKVFINGLNKFNIEVKSSSAQSGQFVVFEQKGSFVFSSRNKSDEEDASTILQYMNVNYDKYKNITTTGVKLEMKDAEYISWVVRHYLSKNETFVITKYDNSFVLFPTNKYGEYFYTTANYRIKKSGSQDVTKSSLQLLKNYFLSFDEESILFYKGKKLFIVTEKKLGLKEKFFVGDIEFMVSEIIENEYYIRKLSNTRNANVIFSIKLKKQQDSFDLKLFEKELD